MNEDLQPQFCIVTRPRKPSDEGTSQVIDGMLKDVLEDDENQKSKSIFSDRFQYGKRSLSQEKNSQGSSDHEYQSCQDDSEAQRRNFEMRSFGGQSQIAQDHQQIHPVDNQSFDISSFHGRIEHYPHNRNSNYINEFNDMSSINLSYEQQQFHFSRQSQMVIGFQNLPINPNLMKFNEQAYYKIQEKELQQELKASKSSFHKKRAQNKVAPAKGSNGTGQMNHWNHNPVEYKVYYPLNEYIEESTQKQDHLPDQTIQAPPKNLQFQNASSADQKSTNESMAQQKSEHLNISDPMKLYETQHFQNQNLMLNRDPEFLLKQHLLQQKLIRQYHEERNKLAQQIEAKNKANFSDSESSSNPMSFQQLIYNNFGSYYGGSSDQDKQLMFEKKILNKTQDNQMTINSESEQKDSQSAYPHQGESEEIKFSSDHSKADVTSQKQKIQEEVSFNVLEQIDLQKDKQQRSSLQPQNFRVHGNSNINKMNRFSNFSDSVTKPQKTKSECEPSEEKSSSNICSSVDPNEIDNLEHMIAGDLQSLENIYLQSNNLLARIGTKINEKQPVVQYPQYYQQPVYEQQRPRYAIPHQQYKSQLNHNARAFVPQMAKQEQQVKSIENIYSLIMDPSCSLSIIKGFELACCKDQKCSRFIQKRLMDPNASWNEKNTFLDSILKNANIRFEQLVLDSFGNYVIQKIQQIPGIRKEYLDLIFHNIKGHMYKYSTNKHGCRVIQTGMEVFDLPQKEQMITELLDQRKVKDCSFNFNGNHVVQQIITQMGQNIGSGPFIEFVSQIEQRVLDYCLNEYCCRIIQRMFEKCHPQLIMKTSDTIVAHFQEMIHNEYGIFVLSSMLENGQNKHKDGILIQIQGKAAEMAIDKDGSKLVENCIKMIWSTHLGGNHQAQISILQMILDEIISLPPVRIPNTNQIYFSDLLTNKYANYVIQTCFDVSDQQRRQIILDKIQNTLFSISNAKDTPLKHILKFLQKHDIMIRGNQIQHKNNLVQQFSQLNVQNEQSKK